jgi:hypothetical protein
MVTLELPPLTDSPGKGKKQGDSQKEATPQQIPLPKGKAPTAQFETGKQEGRASKPEQYLPNWILNLLNQTNRKPVQTKSDKKEKQK